jgi:arylsulfatase
VFPNDWELYDIAADRVERNNVAAQHPDVVKSLAAEWDTWAKRTNVDPWTGPTRLPWGDNAPGRGGAGRQGGRGGQ